MFGPRNILSTVEIIYYVPILVLAVLVSMRHGFARQLGWMSIVLLAVFRLSGSITEIISSYDHSTSLRTASIVLQNFGLASLLISMQGLTTRLNNNLPEHKRIPVRILRLLQLLTTVGIALAISGAVDLTDTKTSNDHEGRTLQRAGILLFGASFLASCAANVRTFLNRHLINSQERPIMYAVAASIPLIAVRVLYSLLAVFQTDTNIFNTISDTKTAVAVEACMAIIEEFAVAAVIIFAGFKVPTLKQYGQQAPAPAAELKDGVPLQQRNYGQLDTRQGGAAYV